MTTNGSGRERSAGKGTFGFSGSAAALVAFAALLTLTAPVLNAVPVSYHAQATYRTPVLGTPFTSDLIVAIGPSANVAVWTPMTFVPFVGDGRLTSTSGLGTGAPATGTLPTIYSAPLGFVQGEARLYVASSKASQMIAHYTGIAGLSTLFPARVTGTQAVVAGWTVSYQVELKVNLGSHRPPPMVVAQVSLQASLGVVDLTTGQPVPGGSAVATVYENTLSTGSFSGAGRVSVAFSTAPMNLEPGTVYRISSALVVSASAISASLEKGATATVTVIVTPATTLDMTFVTLRPAVTPGVVPVGGNPGVSYA